MIDAGLTTETRRARRFIDNHGSTEDTEGCLLATETRGHGAVDTNMLVRYVTNDVPEQAQKAVRVLSSGMPIFVPNSVVLELEWVLRTAYELPRESIIAACRHVLGLPGVIAQDADRLARMLGLYEKGLDLTDAYHLLSCPEGIEFHTFDGLFVKRGRRLGFRLRRVD